MSPKLIICDEIASKEEAISVLNAIHSGVKLIATTHAGTFEELMSKESIKELLNSGAFEYAIGIQRKDNSFDYTYTCNKL